MPPVTLLTLVFPLAFCIPLVGMINSNIDKVRNSKVEASSGSDHDSCHLTSNSDHVGLEITPIFDDYVLEWMFETFMEEETSSRSLYAFT